jgi:hypothetical protein
LAKKPKYPLPTPSNSSDKEVAAYEYSDKRRNNPEVDRGIESLKVINHE